MLFIKIEYVPVLKVPIKSSSLFSLKTVGTIDKNRYKNFKLYKCMVYEINEKKGYFSNFYYN